MNKWEHEEKFLKIIREMKNIEGNIYLTLMAAETRLLIELEIEGRLKNKDDALALCNFLISTLENKGE